MKKELVNVKKILFILIALILVSSVSGQSANFSPAFNADKEASFEKDAFLFSENNLKARFFGEINQSCVDIECNKYEDACVTWNKFKDTCYVPGKICSLPSCKKYKIYCEMVIINQDEKPLDASFDAYYTTADGTKHLVEKMSYNIEQGQGHPFVWTYEANTDNLGHCEHSLIPITKRSAGSPCQSGGLTTAVIKEYQMTYPDEDFLQVTNKEAVKDVSQLKDLTCLQYMDVTDSAVNGDIIYLKNLNNLEVFSLYSTPNVSGNICSLAGATKLRNFKIAFNPLIIGDVSCLKNLNKMETFAMTHTQISGDISVFANMPNLKAIYIGGTNIHGDICALSNLTNLEEFGIADEYPGNPDITGDLSCLKNLKKLTRVALYNTNATNCEQFTKDHPNIEQGGCSRESMKTLVDYAQRYEKKIGKETQTQVKGQSNYAPADTRGTVQNNIVSEPKEPDNRNFFTKIIDWFKQVFSRASAKNKAAVESKSEDVNQIRPQAGPEGCKTQAECDAVCSKPENKELCSKFTPPSSANGREEKPREGGPSAGESDVRPNLEQEEGPGGCKTRTECEAYCSNPEHKDACSKFSHADEGQTPGQQQMNPPPDTSSKPVCRASVLPSSKGAAPYSAKVCVDNPNERIQQDYQDYVDFEGDGSWDDYESKHGCHSFTFRTKGTFHPTAKIVNSNGIESDVCQTTLIVN